MYYLLIMKQFNVVDIWNSMYYLLIYLVNLKLQQKNKVY